MKYRAEIDGLRAVAVVPVILFHAGFDRFSGGFVGVDIFFVISGYLITTILIDDIEKGRFSITRFYERRARRILPALLFVVLVCLPFAWMWMVPSQLKNFSQSLVAVSLFSSNILFWLESGYFEVAAEEKPLLHTWSLAVEEQYYLIFPIFLILAWRLGRERVFWMIALFAALSLAFSEWGWRHAPSANFYLAPARVWELFAGSIAAFILQRRGVQPNNALSLLGLASILIAIFVFDEQTPFPSVYALLPVGGVVLLVLFADRETLAGKLLGTPILVGIGLISYSAYLWHQPLFAFARIYLLEEPSDGLMLALSGVSLLLAILSWKYVEQPFRGRRAIPRTQRDVFKYSGCGLVVIIGLGLFGHVNQGFESRFSKVLLGDVDHLEFHKYVDLRYVDCKPRKLAENALSWDGFLRCKQSRKGDPEWVLLGDSHAEHLFLGMAEAAPSKNIAFYVHGGKPYMSNENYRQIYNVLLSASRPQRIFLTMHYVARLRDADNFQEEFRGIIQGLQAAGHEVILLGDIPTYEIHPRDCLYAQSAAQAKDYCSMTVKEAEAQEAVYHDSLTQLAQAFSLKHYRLADSLCTETGCSMVQDDTILYRDIDHLNIPGSLLVGRHLLTLMDEDQAVAIPLPTSGG